jgi:hypothetical protein
MTRITRVEVIDENGRSYVSWEDDNNDIVTSIQDDGKTLKVFVNKVKPKTLFDVIRNLGYSFDAVYEIVDAVEEFEKSKEFQPTPQTNEEVEQGLKDAMRTAKEEGVFDEQENDKNFKSSLDLIREWGEKNKPLNLKELVWEWWVDIFTRNSDLDADASIDILVDMIDKKFIPPSHDTNGYEWEKCLKMMRDKLR